MKMKLKLKLNYITPIAWDIALFRILRKTPRILCNFRDYLLFLDQKKNKKWEIAKAKNVYIADHKHTSAQQSAGKPLQL